ncbi:cell division cycle and apoptosis regulator protein 1 isoform X3 [Brienomyrus brachyistius]|uniref:cell division cycle and apoptosis regulator protein 1 isoform X3 n=1 Tax=Brienomyrus brachyistius TaxID=42636 RepID=UPI0020B339A6|nr:cell division cycle and apoptosis regulator protein 1 isoform X3 [Brienomyrus brachyistius]
MAQFGGQKNPPWAAQFAATAVSQPGHSGQPLDLNSLHCQYTALGVQQPSLLGASPSMYSQQSALAAASLSSQSAASYQLSQQTATLQQQAAAAAAALQQSQINTALQQYQQQPQPPPPQQTLYNVPHQMPQPQPGLLSQPPVALPSPQPAAQITVSYPTPRSSHQQQPQPQKQRVFTGVVSKLHDTFGFVDEDVFFQLSAVKGKTPQVGDRVLVEAVYNPNMPFKWNAQRIQTLPQLASQTSQPPGPAMMKPGPSMLQALPPPTTFSVPTQAPPPSLLQAQISAATLAPLLQTPPQPLLPQPPSKDSVFSGGLLQPPVRMMPQQQPVRRLDPGPRFPGRNDRPELILRKDDRSRERDRERRRSRERTPTRKRSRDRSPRRERSPRRPRRATPRYTVQFSKFSLDGRSCDMMELRRRYQSLYIPSDFFNAEFTWVDAFPLSRPFQFGNYCNFHIMHKEVDSLVKNTAVLEPPDANHSYSAKVMLLATPSMDELYHKSCALAEDPPELRDSFQHPARLIKEEEEKDEDDSKEVTTPTHWSKLDPKTMKVSDLRKELESRSLSSKGLKSQLIARLTKQLKGEEQVEETKETEKPEAGPAEEEETGRTEDDREEEERRRLEEQERQRRERRYILPEEPSIIVHPNWGAKNGKFDCSIMSLSVLLDYRLEDNKEHSFEVSLFAELFNEMLQRDFGYRIYKALAAVPIKEDKRDKRDKGKKEAEKKDTKRDKEEENGEPSAKKGREDKREEDKERTLRKEESRDEDEDSTTNAEEYDPLEAEEAEDDEDDEDSDGRDRRDDRRDDRKSREQSSKDKEKEKKQMITHDKDLLMAFVYFDQSHCGYLLEKDVEEIMYTLGLHLSRAQVKKLLNKPLIRESCFYRKLTDQPKDEVAPPISEESPDNLSGNRALLPSCKVKGEPNESGGLIVYNGAMVDVGSVLQKLDKSERAREEIEQKLMLQDTKMEEDAKAISQLESANSSLLREVEELKSSLAQTQKNLAATEETQSCLQDQLQKTVCSLTTVMKELQGVLRKDLPEEENDPKVQTNGSED